MNVVEDPLFLIAAWGDEFSNVDEDRWVYMNSPVSRFDGKLHEVSAEVFAMWYANVFKMTDVLTTSYYYARYSETVSTVRTWAMTEAQNIDAGSGSTDWYVNDTGFPLPRNFASGNAIGFQDPWFQGIRDDGRELFTNISYYFYVRQKKFYIWHTFAPIYVTYEGDPMESRIDEKEMYMKHSHTYPWGDITTTENRRTITATYY